MNLSDLTIKTHFREINLSDIVDQLGEDEARQILSNFSCPINLDVQNFLLLKAILLLFKKVREQRKKQKN